MLGHGALSGSPLSAPSENVNASQDVSCSSISSTLSIFALTIAYTLLLPAILPSVVSYSPTVDSGETSVLASSISSGSSLFSPTLSHISEVSSISSGSSLFSPSTSYELETGTVLQSSTLYPTTVAPGDVSVLSTDIGSSSSTYSPSVIQNVSTNNISSGSSLFSPTLLYISEVSSISSGSSLFSPSVVQNISTNSISSGSSLFSPSLSHVIEVSALPTTLVILSPSVAHEVLTAFISSSIIIYQSNIEYSSLNSTIVSNSVLFLPTVAYNTLSQHIPSSSVVGQLFSISINVENSTIVSNISLFSPSSSYELTLNTIGSSLLIYEPTVPPSGISVLSSNIEPSSVIFSPSLSYIINSENIPSTTSIYAQAVSYAISTSTINSSNVLNSNVLSYGVVGGNILSTVLLNEPTINYVSNSSTIQSTVELYQLEIIPGPVFVTTDLIQSTSVLNVPSFTYALVLNSIDSTLELYNLNVEYEIVTPIINNVNTLFSLEVALTITPNVKIIKPVKRKPFFLPPRDRNILAKQSNDLFKLAVSSVTYFVRENSDKEPEDFLYLESADQELVLGTKYSTRAFVKKVPLKATLKKFGLEEARDIYVEFRKDDLKRRSLPEPVVGSYFIVEKEFYKVTENSNDDYVDHYDHNINYSILGMKIKNSSFKDFEAVENKKQKTLFFSNQDKDNVIRQASDLFRVSVPSLTYFVREGADKEPEDLIYMESADQELVLGKQYNIRAFVRKVPLVATSNKYGLEEMRNLEVGFKVNDFMKKSIPKPIIGSHFIVENEFYKIVNTINSGYVNHLDNYVDYVVIGEKLRNHTFKDIEVLDGEKLNTLFFGSQDIKNLSDNHSFLFKKVFSMHTFIERKYDENIDLLYLENLDKNNLPGIRYELPAFVLTNPTKKKLLKYGIQEERDLQIELSVALSLQYLEKLDTTVGHGDGLPDIGSVMIFRGEPYIILDSTPQYYHGNTEAKIGKNLFAKKLKNSIFVDGKSAEIPEEIIGSGSIDPYSD